MPDDSELTVIASRAIRILLSVPQEIQEIQLKDSKAINVYAGILIQLAKSDIYLQDAASEAPVLLRCEDLSDRYAYELSSLLSKALDSRRSKIETRDQWCNVFKLPEGAFGVLQVPAA